MWGIQGAAVATVAGFGVQAALYYRQAQALRRAPYDLRRLAAIIVVALPFMAVGWWNNDLSLGAIAVKGVLLLLDMGLLVLLRLVDVARLKGEVKMVWTR